MPVKLTIADAIDKNKISSANVWVILFEVDIQTTDENGTVTTVETLLFAKNNEDVLYQGKTYIASDFTMDFNKDLNTEPTMAVNVFDPTGTIRQACEDYGGGVGFPVTMTVINTGNLEAPPELQEEFIVISTSAPDFNVNFTLGAENPLKSEFPYRRQYRDRCPWPYKGTRCGYSGNIVGCDYTLNGPNGCKVHGNMPRFGGFPALQNRN